MTKLLNHCSSMLRSAVLVAVASFLGSGLVFSQTADPIVYQVPESSTDFRSQYAVELLQLILKNTDTQRKTKPLKTTASQDRVLMLLNDGVIDVFWSGASKFRNQEFTPIEFPIYKGLLGYRLVLVNSEQPDLLAKTRTLEALKKFTVGQGGDWPDTRVYSENGFVVQTTSTYEGLFNMLSKKRFDLFPRSIVEVWRELESFGSYDITLDEHILIHYPFAMFYYVRKNDKKLAALLNLGFQRIKDNGQFDELFYHYYGDIINKAHIPSRNVIEMPNSLFPKQSEQQKEHYLRLH